MKSDLDKIKEIMGTQRSERVMCFGKYSGENLSDIPDHYLEWLLSREIDYSLKCDIEKELIRKDRKALK
jgi:hypothetical protein